MNFEETYTRLFKPILSYIASRVSSLQTAHELAADTWQQVWAHREQFDPSRGNEQQWVFTIARNQVNKHLRFWQFKRFFSLTEQEEIIQSGEKAPLERLADQEKKQVLLAVFATLADRERDLLALKFQSGLNNRQIAQMTGLSESNVGTIVNRALNKLRSQLEDL